MTFCWKGRHQTAWALERCCSTSKPYPKKRKPGWNQYSMNIITCYWKGKHAAAWSWTGCWSASLEPRPSGHARWQCMTARLILSRYPKGSIITFDSETPNSLSLERLLKHLKTIPKQMKIWVEPIQHEQYHFLLKRGTQLAKDVEASQCSAYWNNNWTNESLISALSLFIGKHQTGWAWMTSNRLILEKIKQAELGWHQTGWAWKTSNKLSLENIKQAELGKSVDATYITYMGCKTKTLQPLGRVNVLFANRWNLMTSSYLVFFCCLCSGL